MLINFNDTLLDIKGEVLKEDKKEFTLGVLCISALMAPTPQASKLSGEDKVARVLLAEDIHVKGELDVKAEDVVMLKELINDAYPSPLVVARCWALLDPKVKAVADKA